MDEAAGAGAGTWACMRPGPRSGTAAPSWVKWLRGRYRPARRRGRKIDMVADGLGVHGWGIVARHSMLRRGRPPPFVVM